MIQRPTFFSPIHLLAVLLATFILITGCHRETKKNADDGMPVEHLYDKAHTLMKKGNWAGAELSFKRLIAQYPYGPYTEQAMVENAYAQYKSGKHDDAVSSIDRFIRTYPTHHNIPSYVLPAWPEQQQPRHHIFTQSLVTGPQSP